MPRTSELTALGLAIALGAIGACAIINAAISGGTCEVDRDCSLFAEACSTSGCVSLPDNVRGVSCFDSADCLGGSPLSLPCPGEQCTCNQHSNTCVVLGGPCQDNFDCDLLEFCHNQTQTCMFPFQCTDHEDCRGELCSREGCVPEEELKSFGPFCAGDGDCESNLCLSNHCFIPGPEPCKVSAECGDGYCAFETNTCLIPGF